MLKFAVMFLCVLYYPRQVWNAPVIKASGVQWTEPKGNGKGNLTLIMIPQNNSCTNDTDVLIAVKSDYQVVSQDTQLLNLVINEYQNDTLNKSKFNENENQISGIKPSNLDTWKNQDNVNQGNGCNISSKNDAIATQATCVNGITHSTNGYKKNISLFDTLTCTTKGSQNINKDALKPVESINQGYKSDIINECGKQNNTGSGSPFNTNINQYNELNVPKDISNEDQTPQIHQAVDDFSRNGGKNVLNSNQSSKASDAISYADFLKHSNSVGDVEQHSELDSVKGSNNVNFYEAEKKTPVQVNEQSSAKAGNNKNVVDKEYPSNGNAINIFKFLNAAQTRETTAPVTKDSLDVFKFLSVVEPSHITPARIQGFSTVNMYKMLNITDHNGVTSANTANSKNPNSQLFNENEIKIFQLLNITEPNIGNKLKKMNEGNVINNDSPQNVGSDNNISNEVVNIISKLKQEPIKEERDLRSDSLTGNQAEELVALDEGDSDTKAKLSKEDYLASASDEEILKKQLNLFNLNQIVESKAEENENSECNPGVLTTCYVVKVGADNCSVNSQQETYLQTSSVISLGGIENTASVIHSEVEATTSTTTFSDVSTTASANNFNVKGNADDYTIDSQKDTYPQTTSDISLDGGENTATVTHSETEVTTVFTSSAHSPTCRTSIIYICNPQTVTGEYEQISEKVEEKIHEMAENLTTKPHIEVEGSQKKITLEPHVNCSSLLKSKQSSGSLSDEPIVQPNQDAQFKEKVFPLVESSIFLANNKEMPKGKNVPILLNSSSSDYIMDVFLSSHDEKLAKLHANPSGPTINEEVLEDIPPEIGRVRNEEGKKKISIENSKSMNNEQVLHPGQVLKMRFAGKHFVVEQMPSYRSEKFDKNCNFTTDSVLVSDEMEPDEEGNETTQRAKTSKTHKPTREIISTTKQTVSGGSTHLPVTTQITSKQPDRTSRMNEKGGYIKNYSVTSTHIPTREPKVESEKNESLMKGPSKTKTTTEQIEGNENTYSQITTQGSSHTQEEGPIHVTEYKTKKISTKPHFDVSTTEKPHVPTSRQKPSENKQGNEENFKIPGESVKEIVIQIIRNTKKPGKSNPKPCYNTGEDNHMVDEISFQNNQIQRPTVKKIYVEKIKPGGYEMEISNVEDSQQKNIGDWYPEPQENENQIDSIVQQLKPGGYETEMSNVEDIQQQNIGYWYPKPQENENKIGNIVQKLKGRGYEIEMSNVEDNQQQNIKSWHPKPQENENELVNKYGVYPYFDEKSILLDNFYVGKENSEDVIPVIPDSDKVNNAIFKGSDKFEKALSYSDLKLLVDGNNVINGA